MPLPQTMKTWADPFLESFRPTFARGQEFGMAQRLAAMKAQAQAAIGGWGTKPIEGAPQADIYGQQMFYGGLPLTEVDKARQDLLESQAAFLDYMRGLTEEAVREGKPITKIGPGGITLEEEPTPTTYKMTPTDIKSIMEAEMATKPWLTRAFGKATPWATPTEAQIQQAIYGKQLQQFGLGAPPAAAPAVPKEKEKVEPIPEDKVRLVKAGKFYKVPKDQLEEALKQGYIQVDEYGNTI